VRLFVAVVLPPATRDSLAAAVAPVRERHGGPRWIPPERWHITLVFLGAVDEAVALPRLHRALAVAAGDAAPLRLQVAGAGRFPGGGAPRVLWAGVTGDLDALTALARATRRAARASRITVERAAFRAHLTLGRWRQGDDADGDIDAALADYRGPAFEVTEIELLRSHLGPKPSYDQIGRWTLGSGPE
jgi:2'-5' RNA ligase